MSKRHAAWAFSRGGVERGQSHYPVMVVLHTALLVGAVAEVLVADRPFLPALGWAMLALVVAARPCAGGASDPRPPVEHPRHRRPRGSRSCDRGPYRLIPHPNYVAVVVEGFALPLVHTAWLTALVFTVANAALLTVRIRVENAALREIASPVGAPDGAAPECRRHRHRRGPGRARRGVVRRALGSRSRRPRASRRHRSTRPAAKASCPAPSRPRRARGRPAGPRLRGIRYVARGRVVEADFRAGPGRGVRRTTLHGALREAVAARASRCSRSARATSPRTRRRDRGHPRQGHARRPVRTAPWVLAADGLHSPMRRSLGLDRPRRRGRAGSAPAPYGLRQHYGIARGPTTSRCTGARTARPTSPRSPTTSSAWRS